MWLNVNPGVDNRQFALMRPLIQKVHTFTHVQKHACLIHTYTRMHVCALMHGCRVQGQRSQILHLIPFWVLAALLTLGLVKHIKINFPFWLRLLLLLK